MAFREDTGEVVGVAPREEAPRMPSLIDSRRHPDLADAVQRPDGADPCEVRAARDAVIDDLSDPFNMVDVGAAVIAATNKARRLSREQ